jgi:hypothetical protein
MNICIEILLLIVLNTITIIVFNLFGKLIKLLLVPTGTTEGKPFFNFFIECLIGLLVITCIFSIYKSRFETVNLIAFLLISGYLFCNWKNKSLTIPKGFFTRSPIVYLYVTFITIIITLLSISYVYKGDIDEDVSFYANIARELGYSGKENILHYFNQYENLGTMPYHYCELWLGSILFKLKWFGISNAIVFRYGCYAILRTLAILGFLALVETIKKISLLDIFICILLTLFNTLFITELFNSSWSIQTSFWLRPNLIIYYIFIFAIFVLTINRKYSQALIIILLFSITTTTSAPAIYPTLVIGLLLQLFSNSHNKTQIFFYLNWLFLIALTAFSLFVFYKITGGDKKLLNPQLNSFDDILVYTTSIWKAIVFFLVTLPLRALAIMVIPVISLFIVFGKKSFFILKANKINIAFSLLLTISGIFIFQLTTFIDNTYQFPYVGYTACYIIAVFLFYHIIYAAARKPINILAMSASAIYLFFNLLFIKNDLNFDFKSNTLTELNLKRKGLSVEYIVDLNNLLKNKTKLVGGYIYDMDDFEKMDERSIEITHSTAQLGSYLYYFNSNIYLYPFTDPNKIYEGVNSKSLFFRRHKVITDMLPFYIESLTEKNYNSLLKTYFSNNKIDFVIADKNFKHKYLDGICISKKIIDKNTGNQLIFFCNN